MDGVNENEKTEMKTALSILMDSVLNLLEKDPHQFGTRPCSTCTAVSSIIGKPFGCVKVAKRKAECAKNTEQLD